MDILLFIMLLFSNMLVLAQCLAEDSSIASTQLTEPRSPYTLPIEDAGTALAETASAAVIPQTLFSLLHAGRNRGRDRDSRVLPVVKKEVSFSTLIQQVLEKKSGLLAKDSDKNHVSASYTEGQDPTMFAKESPNSRQLSITKKQKKFVLPKDDDAGSHKLKTTWPQEDGSTQTETKNEQGEKGEKERGTKAVGDSVMCFLCVTVMDEMKKTMDDPKMEKNMEDAMENGLCPFVPEGLDCSTKVHMYGPILFEMIHKEMDPKTFCQDMTMCEDNPALSLATAVLDSLKLTAESRKLPTAAQRPLTAASANPSHHPHNSIPQSDPTQGSPDSSQNSDDSAWTSASLQHNSPSLGPQSASDPTTDFNNHIKNPDVTQPASHVQQAQAAFSKYSDATVQVSAQLPRHSLNSVPQSVSDSTPHSHGNKSYPAASVPQPATDSRHRPVQSQEPCSLHSTSQSPLSGGLLKLVSAYLCRSHGDCSANSDMEDGDSFAEQQPGSGTLNAVDTSLTFLPNAGHSRTRYRVS